MLIKLGVPVKFTVQSPLPLLPGSNYKKYEFQILFRWAVNALPGESWPTANRSRYLIFIYSWKLERSQNNYEFRCLLKMVYILIHRYWICKCWNYGFLDNYSEVALLYYLNYCHKSIHFKNDVKNIEGGRGYWTLN